MERVENGVKGVTHGLSERGVRVVKAVDSTVRAQLSSGPMLFASRPHAPHPLSSSARSDRTC